MFDTVDNSLKSDNNLQIATTARAVKFAGSRMTNPLTVKILTEDLCTLMANADIEVKKNALEALTSIIHGNWHTMKNDLRACIGDILNFALQETTIRKDLIQEVDLGPFKHKVDKGLPMRKAAFQLLETL